MRIDEDDRHHVDTGTLKILPLGGLGEIGMNMTLFGVGEDWFIVDAGVQFCDASMIGAERMVQDLGLLDEYRDRVKAIILTHGHEDHIGAVEYVVGRIPVPVYAPPFVCELIRLKSAEYGSTNKPNLIPVTPDSTVDVGPIQVRFVRVTHSIPDCHALVMRTPVGTVVHSGDFRIDLEPMDGRPFDTEAFRRIGDEGVRLLLADSTNAEVPGRTRPEREVIELLRERIEAAEGRVIVSLFASNVHRVRALIDVAQACGRRVALVGRSLNVYMEAARRTFQHTPPEDLVTPANIERVHDAKMLVLCTGSQAEPRSALYRASNADHPDLRIRPSDLVILSSRIIPGNEKPIARMINNLGRLGATVIHERVAKVHGSGHAYREELRELLELVRPRTFVPVHGEYAFLRAHAALAEECGVEEVRVLENGHLLEVGPTDSTVLEQIPLTFHYVDGPLIGDAGELRLDERKRIAWTGVVAAHVKAHRGRKRWTVHVDVQAVGCPTIEDGLLNDVAEHAADALADLPIEASRKELESTLVASIRAFFRRRMDRKPTVMPFVELKEP
jgi:ribonuclease J